MDVGGGGAGAVRIINLLSQHDILVWNLLVNSYEKSMVTILKKEA